MEAGKCFFSFDTDKTVRARPQSVATGQSEEAVWAILWASLLSSSCDGVPVEYRCRPVTCITT